MRILAALALGSSLILGGCTNPDGSTNVGGTLALGAGAALAAGLLIASSNQGSSRRYDNNRYQGRGHDRGYRNPGYADNRGYRRW